MSQGRGDVSQRRRDIGDGGWTKIYKKGTRIYTIFYSRIPPQGNV